MWPCNGNLPQICPQFCTHKSRLPKPYKAHVPLRVALVSIVALGIVVGLLALSGNLLSFPHDFLTFWHQMNWIKFAIAVGAVALLSTGGIIILHRVIHKTVNKITGQKIGKLSGSDHWVPAYSYNPHKKTYLPGYIDVSTLDENGNGIAFFYAKKPPLDNYRVGISIMATSALHGVATMAYYLARALAAPFYISGCLFIEKIDKKPMFKDRFFNKDDILKEVNKSLTKFIEAPGFAAAEFFAAAFMFFDPMNGTKLLWNVGSAWTGGLMKPECFWSVKGPGPLWKWQEWEGGGPVTKLGKTGFIGPGCCHPEGGVPCQNGEVVYQENGYGVFWSLTRVLDSTLGKTYLLVT